MNFSFAIPSTTNIQKTTFSSLNKFILKNGIRIICQKDSTSSLTVARIFIKGGKLAEPEGKSGLSFLTTRLAVDPGSSNDVQKIATMGSKISVNGSFDYTTIEIECLSKNFEKTIKIISKSFTKPLFSGIRINRIKKIMEARQKREKEEPWLLIENIHNNLRFGKKHYGNPVYGNEESIKSINKKDIKNFYNAYFRGENLIISVVTDLDSNAVYDIIKKYFSKIPAGESKLKKNKAQIILQAQDKFIYKNRRQSLIMIAYPQSEINEKNFALGYLLNVLIGKGTYSRLWALRQKEKLAYSIRSKVNFMLFAGTFSACIETHHDNQEKTVKLLKNEFKKLIENGVSEEELEIAKINSIASFLRENESKSKKAFTFGYFEIHGLGYEYPNKFFNIIENISLKEFNTYIKKWLKPEYKIQIIIGKKAPQFIKASV
ncbi:insulinase family protein [Candidatus Aminicenantes bacterium AC-335-A11]|nr:insulinase family protein [Candidatus Aminicenantes bacterium AC-335-G13]MCP2605414.1 insulinase family protein [Candidatus Aminicenantes bacterium AC-335-O07]MCP2617819.1 insulinase family protein [Candidatus Aminicenantes bacterium AC-335-A11]